MTKWGRVIAIELLMLVAVAGGLSAQATVYYHEDFNEYADTEALLAAWKTGDLSQLPAEDPNAHPGEPHLEAAYWMLWAQDGKVNGAPESAPIGDENPGNWANNPAERFRRGAPDRNGLTHYLRKLAGVPGAGSDKYINSDSDWVTGHDPMRPADKQKGAGKYEEGYYIDSPAGAIDLSGVAPGSPLWLHFQAQIVLNDDNGTAIFELWVNPDNTNPATWKLAMQRIATARLASRNRTEPYATPETATGIFGVVDLDISQLGLQGKKNVGLRFMHRASIYDYNVIIDEIVIDNVEYGKGDVELFPTETFSTAVFDKLPAGWTSIDNNLGDHPWIAEPLFHRSYSPGTDGVDPLYVNKMDEFFMVSGTYPTENIKYNDEFEDYLLSPVIDCSRAKEMVYLHFDSEARIDSIARRPGDKKVVEMTLDGGKTWSEVWTYQGIGRRSDNMPCFARHIVPIPAAVGKPEVQFRFVIRIKDTLSFWAIDNFKVTGDTQPAAVSDWQEN